MVTVQTAALDELIRKLRRASTPAGLRSVMAAVAEEGIELVREGFDKERDPYGAKWKPLKRRSGRILQDTGRLKASWHRRSVTAQRAVIGSAVGYARFHQSGTDRMPARRMVPSGKLPASWRKQIHAVALKAFKSSIGFK